MAQMGVATKEQLTYIDQTIYDPKTAPLVALQLFRTIKVNPIQMSYRYKVRSTKAMAQAYANRGTDIPVVDEGFLCFNCTGESDAVFSQRQLPLW